MDCCAKRVTKVTTWSAVYGGVSSSTRKLAISNIWSTLQIWRCWNSSGRRNATLTFRRLTMANIAHEEIEMETEKQCPECGHDLRNVRGKLYRCTNCTYGVYRWDSSGEPQHAITVRLPASLHRKLKDEANQISLKRGEDVSMNSVCIEKLQVPL